METIKSKAIENIEKKMEDMDASSIRLRVLNTVKKFKTSWVDLGQMLYAVWRDKIYKEWGYSNFDIYTSKEIGIRKQTALKLLRSYYFLEKEEPQYLNKDYDSQADAVTVPTFEAVDTLRRASTKKEIDEEDYKRMKANVLEKGKDARDVRKDLTAIVKQRQELQPEEARRKRKQALLRRIVGLLRSVNEEIKISKMLPLKVLKDTEKLIQRIETEIS